MIKATVFAKARRTRGGKPFTAYCTSLTRKDGSTQYMDVRFRRECGAPTDCPSIIEILDGNISKRHVIDAVDESEKTYYTLWVKKWRKSDDEYKDTSLEEFE